MAPTLNEMRARYAKGARPNRVLGPPAQGSEGSGLDLPTGGDAGVLPDFSAPPFNLSTLSRWGVDHHGGDDIFVEGSITHLFDEVDGQQCGAMRARVRVKKDIRDVGRWRVFVTFDRDDRGRATGDALVRVEERFQNDDPDTDDLWAQIGPTVRVQCGDTGDWPERLYLVTGRLIAEQCATSTATAYREFTERSVTGRRG